MKKHFLRLLSAFMIAVTVLSVQLCTPDTETFFSVYAEASSKKTQLAKASVTLTTGETFTQKLLNKNGKAISSKKIKWTSGNKKIAKISSKGIVTALKKGKTTLKAKYKGKTYKFSVTVKNASLKYKSKTLTVGKKFTQKLTDAKGQSIKSSKISFSSSNTKVAIINKKGVVKAVAPGTAKLTAKYKGKKYTFTVKVSNKKTTYKETILAKEYEPVSANIDKNSVLFQSFSDFSMKKFSFDDLKTENLGFIRNFTGNKSDLWIIEDYVELLCDKMNFELVDSYRQDYKDIFFSYGLNYTGRTLIRKPYNILYLDSDEKVSFHIWGKTDRNTLTFTVQWATGLENTDLGYRYDNSFVVPYPSGKSASSGLKRLSDGSFETTDKRMKTNLGKANVIRNGKSYSVDIEYIPESKRLKVMNYSGDESLWINFHEDQLLSNTTLFYNNLSHKRQSALPDLDPEFRVDRTELNTKINGQWLHPVNNDDTYLDASLRVMYYEEGNFAVFYVYTYILAETEFLCAVDLKNSSSTPSDGSSNNSSGSSSSNRIPSTTQSVCRYCNNTGRVDCDSCIDGFYNAGGVYKECVSIRCNNGTKDCSHCNN